MEGVDNLGTMYLVLESVYGIKKQESNWFLGAVWVWHSLVIHLVVYSSEELTVVDNTFSYYFICLLVM